MGIIRKLAVKSYLEELEDFQNRLKKLNEEKLATFLVYSVWLRAISQIEGTINPMARVDKKYTGPNFNPELTAAPLMCQDFLYWIKYLKKVQPHKTVAYELWVHTLRGIFRPEMKEEVQLLWSLLLTSKKNWQQQLDYFTNEDIRLGIDKEFVAKTRDLSEKILHSLPPKQIIS